MSTYGDRPKYLEVDRNNYALKSTGFASDTDISIDTPSNKLILNADELVLQTSKLTYPEPEVVNQITSASTSVPFVGTSGFNVAVTVPLTTAAGAHEDFKILHPRLVGAPGIRCWVPFYSGALGTDGIPMAYCISRFIDGEMEATVFNGHPTNALNGVVAIAFEIIRP